MPHRAIQSRYLIWDFVAGHFAMVLSGIIWKETGLAKVNIYTTRAHLWILLRKFRAHRFAMKGSRLRTALLLQCSRKFFATPVIFLTIKNSSGG